ARELQRRQRLIHRAPANQREHQPGLLRRGADVFRRGFRLHHVDLSHVGRLPPLHRYFAAGAADFSDFAAWPLNVRVGANSPSLRPTMFSFTYPGMNLRLLCTAIVCPTISGTTVDRRDQVLTTFLSPPRFMPSIFSSSEVSTQGPFFSDLLMVVAYFFRRVTMNLSVVLLLRVLKPLVGWPHGLTG